MPQKQRVINKLTHIKNGNFNFKIIQWNKGPSHLINSIDNIINLIQTHQPHIFSLSEANITPQHNIDHLQIKDYTLTTLKLARSCLYVSSDIKFKRRKDLESNSNIWIQIYEPKKNLFFI